MIKSFKNSGEINIANKEFFRPILWINDLVEAISLILDSQVNSGIYNLASFNTSIGELANEISTSGPLGIKAIRNTLNDGLVEEISNAVVKEANEQNKLRNTKDFKEGINASIKRREAKLIGK